MVRPIPSTVSPGLAGGGSGAYPVAETIDAHVELQFMQFVHRRLNTSCHHLQASGDRGARCDGQVDQLGLDSTFAMRCDGWPNRVGSLSASSTPANGLTAFVRAAMLQAPVRGRGPCASGHFPSQRNRRSALANPRTGSPNRRRGDHRFARRPPGDLHSRSKSAGSSETTARSPRQSRRQQQARLETSAASDPCIENVGAVNRGRLTTKFLELAECLDEQLLSELVRHGQMVVKISIDV